MARLREQRRGADALDVLAFGFRLSLCGGLAARAFLLLLRLGLRRCLWGGFTAWALWACFTFWRCFAAWTLLWLLGLRFRCCFALRTLRGFLTLLLRLALRLSLGLALLLALAALQQFFFWVRRRFGLRKNDGSVAVGKGSLLLNLRHRRCMRNGGHKSRLDCNGNRHQGKNDPGHQFILIQHGASSSAVFICVCPAALGHSLHIVALNNARHAVLFQ